MKKKIECLRCGQCCYYLEFGKAVPCRFLYYLKDGRTGCSVYAYRHTVKPVPGLDAFCLDRMESKYDFPGCPYNTGKPLFPVALPVKKLNRIR